MTEEEFSYKYVLIGKDPMPINTEDRNGLLMWAQWFEDPRNRVIRQDYVGPFFISTVFLGIDHSFSFHDDDGPPILFETMAFLWGDEVYQNRYATWDEAMAQHMELIRDPRWPLRWTWRRIWNFWRRLQWKVKGWIEDHLKKQTPSEGVRGRSA